LFDLVQQNRPFVPEEEAFKEFSVLLDATLSAAVGEVEDHPGEHTAPQRHALPQLRAVHPEQDGSS